MSKCNAELVPLRAPDAGVDALIAELRVTRDQLIVMLDDLETSGDGKLSERVEALSKEKNEIEQRFARVDDCFNILDAIRLDFKELAERRVRLERSLDEVETDSSGKSLIDRQDALNEFAVQARLRLGKLQDSSATLNQFKESLARSQAELAPLQGSVFGIEALIAEVNTNRDLLVKTLGQIEFKGDEMLSSRVEALSNNKVEIDARLARVFENFQKLNSMRKDIGEIVHQHQRHAQPDRLTRPPLECDIFRHQSTLSHRLREPATELAGPASSTQSPLCGDTADSCH